MKNNQQSNEEAQIQEDLSEVLQVRRDKLKKLQYVKKKYRFNSRFSFYFLFYNNKFYVPFNV